MRTNEGPDYRWALRPCWLWIRRHHYTTMAADALHNSHNSPEAIADLGLGTSAAEGGLSGKAA
jgi:hypothetical protein